MTLLYSQDVPRKVCRTEVRMEDFFKSKFHHNNQTCRQTNYHAFEKNRYQIISANLGTNTTKFEQKRMLEFLIKPPI